MYATVGNIQAVGLTSDSGRLNSRTETQIEELHEVLTDINRTIEQMSDILEPITVPLPVEGSVAGVAPQKPSTTRIYDKLDQLKDRAIDTANRLESLKRSIDL